MRKISKFDNNIRIQYLGANKTVTGSATYVEIDDYKFLVDFGMYQDSTLSIEKQYELNRRKLPINFEELDAVIVTHGHLDHVGKLGMLPSLGFQGSIYCTALTSDLIELSLTDCAYIMNRETEKVNKKRTRNKLIPLYTQRHVEQVIDCMRGYSFNKEIVLNDKVTLTFLPAGHIQGASMVLIKYKNGYKEKNLLFSGDTSGERTFKPFTKPANLDGLVLSYAQIESTYGGQSHGDVNPMQQLEDCINETAFENEKTLFIPVFSISRSTEVLFMLKQIYEKCPHFNDIPIFLASPMSCKAQNIVGKSQHMEFYDKKWHEHMDLFQWDGINYLDSFEKVKSELLNKIPKIVLSSSGMCNAGYSSFLCSAYLPIKNNKILFSGYQGLGTTGRKILEHKQKTINIDNKPVKIKCQVDFLKGMSSHADELEMLKMLSKLNRKKLKKIVINHGEEERSEIFKDVLKKEFKGVDIIIPKHEQIVRL